MCAHNYQISYNIETKEKKQKIFTINNYNCKNYGILKWKLIYIKIILMKCDNI